VESLGVTLGLGLLVELFAYRAWPAGTTEVTDIVLQWECLGEPALLAGIFVVTFFPSLVWVVLHPWIDARRIDRNPLLEHRIRRNHRRFLVESIVMHGVSFLAAAVVGTQSLWEIPPSLRLPMALAA
jgi:hypothetical protein